MVAVFGLFASLSMIMMQQMGFGLAIAVLIDATVIRAVLVPSTMKLLGEWNWYLPAWLESCLGGLSQPSPYAATGSVRGRSMDATPLPGAHRRPPKTAAR